LTAPTDHALNAASTIFYATPDFLIGIVGIL
jgi:ABC-type dipeptide/oligopeptide/nickel transport system permease component